MKQLFLFLGLFPLFTFASIEVTIETNSFRSRTSIPYVKIRLGDRNLSANSNGYCSFTLYDQGLLMDTLFISHPEYIFEQIPLGGHQVEIQNESIRIQITGYPKVSRIYQFQEATAEKKKFPKNTLIRPDLVNLCDTSTLVELIMGEESYTWDPVKKQFPFDVKAIPIEQYQSDCKIKINGSSHPFPLQWFQSSYIFPLHNQKQIEKMGRSLMAYMELVKKKKKALADQKKKYEIELMRKQKSIDSLIAVINNEPRAPYPEEEVEAIFEEIIDFPNIQSSPPMTEERFQSEISSRIRKFPTQVPIRIALKFVVGKDGKVICSDKQVSSEAENLIHEITQFVQTYSWRPAEVGGRKTIDVFYIVIETF
ncbi:MAG: hypothetical protein R2799_04300 [Crocinitomicaceae bacterium]